LRSDSHIPPDKKCARHTASREGAAIAGANIPEACRWLIINLKAIRHDDPAMNKKNIFSLARKKNIYYIYTIHYFYKPTLFIA